MGDALGAVRAGLRECHGLVSGADAGELPAEDLLSGLIAALQPRGRPGPRPEGTASPAGGGRGAAPHPSPPRTGAPGSPQRSATGPGAGRGRGVGAPGPPHRPRGAEGKPCAQDRGRGGPGSEAAHLAPAPSPEAEFGDTVDELEVTPLSGLGESDPPRTAPPTSKLLPLKFRGRGAGGGAGMCCAVGPETLLGRSSGPRASGSAVLEGKEARCALVCVGRGIASERRRASGKGGRRALGAGIGRGEATSRPCAISACFGSSSAATAARGGDGAGTVWVRGSAPRADISSSF